jgi:hypothetical protein
MSMLSVAHCMLSTRVRGEKAWRSWQQPAQTAVQVLIGAKADASALDGAGMAPLHYATIGRNAAAFLARSRARARRATNAPLQDTQAQRAR